jgi:hypothetical protein
LPSRCRASSITARSSGSTYSCATLRRRHQLAGRVITEHLHQAGVDRDELALVGDLVDAVEHFLEQPAEALLAQLQRPLGALAGDGDARQLADAAEQLEVLEDRHAGPGEVNGEGADHAAVGVLDRHRPATAVAVLEGALALFGPHRRGADIGHAGGLVDCARGHRLLLEVAEADAADMIAEAVGQAGRGQQLEFVAALVEHVERGMQVRRDAGDGFRRCGHDRGQRRIGRDALEDFALAGGAQARGLALADVEDRRAQHVAAVELDARQAHFALDRVAVAVLVQPFEAQFLAGQHQLDVLARQVGALAAVGLYRRGEVERPARQQRRAIRLEQLLGLVVGVDEVVGRRVEHDDGLGCAVDQ